MSRALTGIKILAVIPHFSAQKELFERVVAAVQGQLSVAPVEIVIVANNPRHIPEILNTPNTGLRQIRPPSMWVTQARLRLLAKPTTVTIYGCCKRTQFQNQTAFRCCCRRFTPRQVKHPWPWLARFTLRGQG